MSGYQANSFPLSGPSACWGLLKVPVRCHHYKSQQYHVPLRNYGNQRACLFKVKFYFQLILNVVR